MKKFVIKREFILLILLILLLLLFFYDVFRGSDYFANVVYLSQNGYLFQDLDFLEDSLRENIGKYEANVASFNINTEAEVLAEIESISKDLMVDVYSASFIRSEGSEDGKLNLDLCLKGDLSKIIGVADLIGKNILNSKINKFRIDSVDDLYIGDFSYEIYRF